VCVAKKQPILIGIWIALFGLWLKPFVCGAAILTVVIGAIVYHFRRRAQQMV
jgi:hypothetical protein